MNVSGWLFDPIKDFLAELFVSHSTAHRNMGSFETFLNLQAAAATQRKQQPAAQRLFCAFCLLFFVFSPFQNPRENLSIIIFFSSSSLFVDHFATECDNS